MLCYHQCSYNCNYSYTCVNADMTVITIVITIVTTYLINRYNHPNIMIVYINDDTPDIQ